MLSDPPQTRGLRVRRKLYFTYGHVAGYVPLRLLSCATICFSSCLSHSRSTMNALRLLLALCLALSASAFTITAPISAVAAPSRVSEITMGRGDRRTAKGKRKAKSFGVFRPRNAELRKRAAAKEASSDSD